MSEHWSLRKHDSKKVYKNLPFSTIKVWILEARIEPQDYVTNAQLQKWVKVSSLKSLQSYFSSNTSDVISSRDVRFAWSNSDEEEGVDIDLTPMIDVTFLLLIFFMVTATFAVHEVMGIKVPKAKHTQGYKEKKLVVSVNAKRQIFIGKREISITDLKSALAQKVSETRQQDVLFAADASIDWGFIGTILDEIKGSGVEDVKLKFEKKKR